MRLRDAKVGQKVKIHLAKNSDGVYTEFNGRLGTYGYYDVSGARWSAPASK